ncbi:putative pentatricopeptide repeat domain-containing protein [Golovinomyces cichoracearum]|uniref:Putative pentatricopeptide repeat domain-containing protein n=1 Tax=Golovinomyces cichoracearum TaxID=62708 RepID=A0A420IH68_9PEZI|nr:putative pentatricopeptide repeat domain-containing protein [Golovinomyces cichoracearum]
MYLSCKISSPLFPGRSRLTRHLRLLNFIPIKSLEKDLFLFINTQCKRGSSLTSSIRKIHHESNDLDFLSATKFTLPGQEDYPIQRVKKHFSQRKTSPTCYSYPRFQEYTEEEYKNKLVKKIVYNVGSAQRYLQYCTKAREEYYRLNKWPGRRIPTWRDIEAVLIQKTPKLGAKLNKAIQVKVPPAWAQKFLFSVDDFIYDVGRRNNCTVQLACSDDSLPIYTEFFLSGPQKSIRSLLSSLIEVVPDIEITRPRAGETFLRHVPSEIKSPRSLPHLISKPVEWTHHNLLNYVQNITAFDPSSHLLRFFLLPYPSNKTNYCVFVMNTIRELILNPLSRPKVSRAALHRAMKYFLKKNRIDYVRELYFNINDLGLVCTTETYNIMLQASAIKEDYHNFHFILTMMLRDGLIPDGETWVAFIMSIPNTETKQYLFQKMKERGLLSDKKIIQKVAGQLIESDLELSILQDQDYGTFIQEMNKKYGSCWLSLDVANRALAVFGKYHLISHTFQLLEDIEDRFTFPDTHSALAMIISCSQSPTPWNSIIELMIRSKFQNLLQPDQETCRLLFRLAWDQRSFNMAKVVWRYACLSATSTATARNRIIRSLKKSLLPTEIQDSLKWSKTAGKVIIGSMKQMHPTLLTSIISPPTFNDMNIIEIGPESLEQSDERKYMKRFNLDLQVFKNWRPSKPFGPVLWSAIKLDMCWRQNNEFYKNEPQWFIDNSICIEISEKNINGRKICWN